MVKSISNIISFIAVILVIYFCELIFDAIIVALNVVNDNNSDIIATAIARIVGAILFYRWAKEGNNSIKLIQKIHPKIIVFAIIVGILLQFGPGLIYGGIAGLFDLNVENNIITDANIIIVLILVIVIAPIEEELGFRAVLFSKLRKNTGFVTAASISSLLFAIIHFNVLLFPIFLFVGMVMAYIYEKQGKIIVNIIVHAINNIMAYSTYLFLNKQMKTLIGFSLWIEIGVGIAGVIVMFWCLGKMSKNATAVKCEDDSNNCFE